MSEQVAWRKISRNAAMKAWQQTADKRRACRQTYEKMNLASSQTLVLVDKQKGSADRKADRQTKLENAYIDRSPGREADTCLLCNWANSFDRKRERVGQASRQSKVGKNLTAGEI
jgi:hypothetical protein